MNSHNSGRIDASGGSTRNISNISGVTCTKGSESWLETEQELSAGNVFSFDYEIENGNGYNTTLEIFDPNETLIKTELLDTNKDCMDCYMTLYDEEHAKKELGDVMWYIAMICESFDWSLEEIMSMNIDKLIARYPISEGFTVERANHRKEGDI